MQKTETRHFESERITHVNDKVKHNEDLCELVYTDSDGIGIITPDGEETHIEWDIATTRYEPVSVRDH